ncbi:hypothetical protein L195_g019881 [Trifolium pratense]|uniref:Uncharacterized protein n=1 Tax=Trifolium pratense TaxID=57577 RepID=A0A2K3N108_TRIPR|nr:hypothetical protein L195_g019881 [Trifolium pratense]
MFFSLDCVLPSLRRYLSRGVVLIAAVSYKKALRILLALRIERRCTFKPFLAFLHSSLRSSPCSSLRPIPKPRVLSELWDFDVEDSNSDSDSSSDSDCVIISPFSFTGKRKNPCRDLVVAEYTLVTMDVTSKYTNEAMVRSFRKAVKLSDSQCEEQIISEPVREDTLSSWETLSY